MTTDENKDIFLKNELFNLSIQGAFMHNRHIYETENKSERKDFRTFLYNRLSLYTKEYEKKVKEEKHIKNLEKLQKEIYKYCKAKKILKENDTLNIDTIQKLLNLYLKYFWVSGYILEPPHCPIDNTIIQELIKEGAKNLKGIKWTKIENIKDYIKIIKTIRQETNDSSVAKWELLIFNNEKTNQK